MMKRINHAYMILMDRETSKTVYAVKTHWDNWCIWEPYLYNGFGVAELKKKFVVLDRGFSSEKLLELDAKL